MDEWSLTHKQAIDTAKYYKKKYHEAQEQLDNGVATAISILKRKSIPPVKRCQRALRALEGER